MKKTGADETVSFVDLECHVTITGQQYPAPQLSVSCCAVVLFVSQSYNGKEFLLCQT